MDIVHMPVEIALIAYLMFPESPLPKGALAVFGLGWADPCGTLEYLARLFGKPALSSPQRLE
jgi:hypothetical protein